MINFIKNNKFISASTLIALILIATILFFFFAGKIKQDNNSKKEPFANTDANREFPENIKNSFMFGTSSERFVPNNTNDDPSPEFRAITKDAVAGMSVIKHNNNGVVEEKVRYTKLKDGHIFETQLSVVSDEEVISNESVLGVGNNIWSQNGNTTLLQYLDEYNEKVSSYIEIFTYGTSSKAQLENTLHLKDNIITSAISPKGTAIFYIIKTDTGSLGYIETVSGEKTLVWTSILTSLSSSWDAQNKILIYTNPSSIAKGVVWTLNPQTGKTKVVLSKKYALSPKINAFGDKILFSSEESKNGIFTLKVLNMETSEIHTLPMSIIAEKCSWGVGGSEYVYCAIPKESIVGSFMEDWYMGLKNTNDELWRININTDNTKKLFDPFEETGEKFDIENIVVSPEEDYLLFKTRVNNILWSLKLPEKVSKNKDI